MAAQFLASHGIDLDTEMAKIQFGGQDSAVKAEHDHHDREALAPAYPPYSQILGVRLPHRSIDSLWDITIQDGKIAAINGHDPSTLESVRHIPGTLDACEQLLMPSLCHAHIHLDKCFLLQDAKFADLEVVDGSFQEAMNVTAKAKARFEVSDLLRRGRRLIKESINHGVTVMRSFVEVDDVVHFNCLEAAVILKREFENLCDVQICAFAQHSLFSGPDSGAKNRELMIRAASWKEVDVLGSTPYVESNVDKMKENVEWIVELSRTSKKHLDLHLDYHMDETKEPLVWFVAETLQAKHWSEIHPKTCVLGHCTRLTYLKPEDWRRLFDAISDMNVSFVGLPTSDLYMMRTNSDTRRTLRVPDLIKTYGVEAAISVNNVGNAFTPQGNCDPLSVASLGVGVYQAGTKEDVEILYDCVSRRAKRVIGYNAPDSQTTFELRLGEPADFVLFQKHDDAWKTPRSISHVVYDSSHSRQTIKKGYLTSR